MAIQNRRGNFADFDKFKMLPGEFAYVLDREELYYCVTPGNVKRVATKEDLIELLETSEDVYIALQKLITELENDSLVVEILTDIISLQEQFDGVIANATVDSEVISARTSRTTGISYTTLSLILEAIESRQIIQDADGKLYQETTEIIDGKEYLKIEEVV